MKLAHLAAYILSNAAVRKICHAFMAIFVSSAALISMPLFAVSPNIVISQIYGGGGNAGAIYQHDFVELFNRSNAPVSMAGWSIQYASAAGTTWAKTDLAGNIPAGGYFLVKLASGGAVGAVLPAAEITGTTNMSGTAGKVALVNATILLTGSGCPFVASVVDYVGYGTTASCVEGTITPLQSAPAPSNTNAILRAVNGCTDSDVNSADFATGTPNPRNSATAANSCSLLPNLSISSVTANEGNTGTTTFTFTVTLSAAAPAGGVTFDIATSNGTATAGSDYIAKTLTSQNIAAGNTTYTFSVDVNGDTAPEGNETFFVTAGNVTGANIIAGQNIGTGTITNDDAAPNLSINNVTANEGDSGTTTFTFTVSLSAAAPAGGVTFDIATADGTATAGSDYAAKSLAAQIIPAGNTTYTFDVLVNGDTVGEPNETFLVNLSNVANAIPVVTQGIGTIVNDDLTAIHAIQGAGNQSPLVGTSVLVEGVVTADFQGPNQLKGFYIQAPDAEADTDPLTSEGIFVFTNLAPYTVAIGDRVRMSATVVEFGTAPNTLTELVTPNITTLTSGNALPAVIDVALPVATQGDLERYEGMRVRFTQALSVSDHFDLAHFGEITLTANGRALQPTNEVDLNDVAASGTASTGSSNLAAVNAFGSLNTRSSILLDDASTLTYPAVIPFINPVDHTLRLGSTVTNLTGILSQSFGSHRLYATVAPAFNYAARPASPPAVGGNVKVASANVLNYFNGDGLGAGFPTSRGADSANEFNRQRAKTIAALNGLNADVIGLLEMENDGVGPQSAVQDLVNGLNADAGAGTWNFIADPVGYAAVPGGSDAIRPVFIYKPAIVNPVGLATTINDAAFVIARAPVAQVFQLVSNGEKFVALINHFKAKGSSGPGLDNDQNDGQSAYNNTRRLQATAIVGFINTLATVTPRVITFGDFNAYEQEDPIDILRAGGLSTIINNSYSYMFNGLSGSLDHALGNAAMMTAIAGFGKWHINADEPIFLDYNVETKNTPGCTSSCTTPDYYDTTPFRASDHDPVLIGLNLMAAQAITFPAISTFSWNGGSVTLSATASSNLMVSYAVTSGPCTIAGAILTATSAGTCDISASQAGDTNFNAAMPVTNSVTIAPTAQNTLNANATLTTILLGGTTTLSTTGGSGAGVVTFASNNTNCTISGVTLTAAAVGMCTITATKAADLNYTLAMATVSVSITALTPQIISFAPISNRSLNNSPFTVGATGGASGNPVIFTASPSGVCTSGGANGATITLVGTGSCTVNANQAGNASFDVAMLASQSFIVALGLADAPTNLLCTAGVNAATCAFNPPAANGTTPIISYILNCLSYDSNGASTVSSITGASSPLTLTGLQAGQIANCNVIAVNSAGAGLLSNTNSIMPFALTATRGGMDVNGDGFGELLVRGSAGSGPKFLQQYRFDLTTNKFSPGYIPDPGSNQYLLGLGDFSLRRKSDLLYQNATTGLVQIAVSDSGVFDSQRPIRVVKPGWVVEAVADLDGDGRADIVWRYIGSPLNPPTNPNDVGVVFVWFMNDANIMEIKPRGGAPLAWDLIGATDLHGSGRADVVWVSPNKQIRVHTSLANRAFMNQSAGTIPAGFTLTRLGDFDGDGYGDFLFRSAAGDIKLWSMQGVMMLKETNMPTIDPAWKIFAIADLNYDGAIDLIFKKPDGTLVVWMMNKTNPGNPTVIDNAGSVNPDFAAIEP